MMILSPSALAPETCHYPLLVEMCHRLGDEREAESEAEREAEREAEGEAEREAERGAEREAETGLSENPSYPHATSTVQT